MNAVALLAEATQAGISLAATERGTLKYAGDHDALERLLPATVEMDLGTLTASPAPALHYASAERLADDRHTCQQCANLTDRGRCLAASRGELPEYPRGYEPDPNWLHRCDGFKSRAGYLDPPRATTPALHPHDEKIAYALLRHWGEDDIDIGQEWLDGLARDPERLNQMLSEAVRLGLAVPAPEPVTERTAEGTAPKAVCGRCKAFESDSINPSGGLGRCLIEAPASRKAGSCWPWPDAEINCNRFEQEGGR